jgi:hypothetical protein
MYETLVGIGPASALAFGGFVKALKNGLIHDGDVVVINLGEGINRAPEFLQSLTYVERGVLRAKECKLINRRRLRRDLWDMIDLM